jgi:hypothetical protein
MTVSILGIFQKTEQWKRLLTQPDGSIGKRILQTTVPLVINVRKPTNPQEKGLVYSRKFKNHPSHGK